MVVTCPADNQSGDETCHDLSDPSSSFQIETDSDASGDSNPPVGL